MFKRKHHLTKDRFRSRIERMINNFKKILIVVLITVVLVTLVLVLKFGKIFPSSSQPSTSPKPKIVENPHTLDACALTRTDNPLVETLTDFDKTLQGTVLGNISKLKKDTVLKSQLITLVSLDNKQTYTFNVAELPGLFVNAQGQTKDSSILNVGQRVRISFSCDKKSRIFKYSKVAILATSASPSATVK